MDQKWILVILMIFREITSGAGVDMAIKEGKPAQIECEPREKGTLVVWFRHLDRTGMEFLASFTNNGVQKVTGNSFSQLFSHSKEWPIYLTLKSFNQFRDSGVYCCASLKNSELKFGNATRLVLEKVKVVKETSPPTQLNTCTTALPCVCEHTNQQDTTPEMFCSLIILGPLAASCGLLLILLIITTFYCNHIRTRRCPHHYKRKPVAAPGKQLMANSHV
ncbi:hypothetical protein PBY51_013519 [Eleginops maclovinus]|uniref:Immunoglobulin V-set domain-containing protein n=1 Tax=Eleginops maclovinus TaxID=56733 RepID=A0AAN7Y505_ELEMC|nr:hypothetical protein PBY51_013519 [Eleginops maclovinus]